MQALALLTVIGNLQLVWFRRSLGLDQLGIKRFIRDVIETPGIVVSKRSDLKISFHPENTYYQTLIDLLVEEPPTSVFFTKWDHFVRKLGS